MPVSRPDTRLSNPSRALDGVAEPRELKQSGSDNHVAHRLEELLFVGYNIGGFEETGAQGSMDCKECLVLGYAAQGPLK